MTSGHFTTLPLSSIIVVREERQRRTLRNIEDLAESISRIGLIHPIVITRDNVLVAGERRLTACRELGWTAIPAQFTDELSDYELASIELEENVKREDIPWQDQCRAIERFHELKKANEPGWSTESTASALGYTVSGINRNLQVAKELHNERIAGADKFSVALNIVARDNERKKTSAIQSVAKVVQKITPEPLAAPEPPPVPLLHADFLEWSASYDGPKFNLLHCDFPYGINVADSPRQNAAIADHYEDSADIYFALLDGLSSAMSRLVADHAHLIFWFSMNYYRQTFDALQGMGWNVNGFPLVWHKSDNAGVAPDPQRLPRRTYETAFFASIGDRKLTQAGAKANSFAFPGSRDGAIHVSEKPKPMLRHFLSMVCDEYSIVLDPTCGSGNALKVALELGATSVFGLEKSEEFYETARANWSA